MQNNSTGSSNPFVGNLYTNGTSSIYSQWINPEVYITRNKNRYKQYSNPPIYYLANNTEFEIEFYNPNNYKIKVDISLNKKLISNSGIVLLPGQRIFLDRFIDESNKFIFKSYEINKSDANIESIIRTNGLIELKFYKEANISSLYTITYTAGYAPHINNSNTITCNYSNINNTTDGVSTTGYIDYSKNKSSSKFSLDHSQFDCFSTSQMTIKLLPDDQLIDDYTKIKHYCVNCGIRLRNDKWNYCPKCGMKL